MDLFGETDEPEKDSAESQQTTDAFTPVAPAEPEGLIHPRQMDVCLGHRAIEAQLLEQFDKNRLPHGLIFSGPKGIGKATFAFRLARFLLKHRASDPNQGGMFEDTPAATPQTMDVRFDEPAFRQVASAGHADLLTIERAYDAAKDQFKDTVSVEEARKVIPFLRMTASHPGGWRLVIIDDADSMNRNAQNAILKILEEPPANTLIILVCHRLGAMIPTIRSRTQTLNFSPLNMPDFQTLLERGGYSLESAKQQALYDLCEGSIGKALQYIEQGGLETLLQILTLFEQYPRWNWPEIHALAENMARNGRGHAYQSFTQLLPWIFSQMIKAKAKGTPISSETLNIEAIQRLHKQSSLETLLKICENLKSHFDRVERSNLDKRQSVLGAFSIIAA